jgi:uncharacterized protein YndB with AHSA1/START domain
MTRTEETAVSVSIEVDAPLARAFHVFTVEIGTWWDDDKHVLKGPLAEMVFEPFVGGHIIDRGTDGSECRWARVLAYEPPTRVLFSWDFTTRWEVETDPTRTSEVEITFTEITAERTRVVLTHRHLDRHGEGWEGMRDNVGSGWRLTPLAERIDRANHAAGHRLPIITDDIMRTRFTGMADYTTVLLRTTDAFVRPSVDPIIWEHGRRNMALEANGVFAIVLRLTDDTDLAGIGVFAATPDEVRVIMDDDPGVRAGIFTYDIHPARGFPGATLP